MCSLAEEIESLCVKKVPNVYSDLYVWKSTQPASKDCSDGLLVESSLPVRKVYLSSSGWATRVCTAFCLSRIAVWKFNRLHVFFEDSRFSFLAFHWKTLHTKKFLVRTSLKTYPDSIVPSNHPIERNSTSRTHSKWNMCVSAKAFPND